MVASAQAEAGSAGGWAPPEAGRLLGSGNAGKAQGLARALAGLVRALGLAPSRSRARGPAARAAAGEMESGLSSSERTTPRVPSSARLFAGVAGEDERQGLIQHERALLDERSPEEEEQLEKDKAKLSFRELEGESASGAGGSSWVGAAGDGSGEAAPEVPPLDVLNVLLVFMATVGSSAVFVAYYNLLLPLQLLAIVGASSKGSVLGGLSAAGGVLGIVLPPLVGHSSDRLEGPLGRRKPYMLAGMVVQVAALVVAAATAASESMAAVTVVFLLFTVGMILHSTALNAVIPEYPKAQYGTVAGIFGAMTVVGLAFGALSGALAAAIGLGNTYYALTLVVLLPYSCTLWFYREQRVLHPDNDPAHAEAEAVKARGTVESVYAAVEGMLAPLRDHDFFWVFTTRLFAQFGVYTVQEFALFWVNDVLEPHGLAGLSTNTAGTVLFGTLFCGALIASLAIGVASDAAGGKRKGLLIATAFLMALVCFATGFLRTFYAALIFMFLFGLGAGAFLALDYALVCDILPSDQDMARDLGVWHISLVLPQLVAAPVAGLVLDSLQRVGKEHQMPYLGYTVIFILASLYFVLAGALFFKLRNVA